jgi:DNA-binding winged helix-turn-helix (wHTH) protein
VGLRFGEWTFDASRRQLLEGDRPEHLSPKAFEVLGYLIQSGPRAVPKSELLEKLWPGTFVSEATLTSLIAEIRSTLRDDARNPRFLRTAHGFGYAFCGDARDEAAVASSPGAVACRLYFNHLDVDLSEGENVLGRTRSASVWVDSTSVSRRHARIHVDGGRARLEDLGSKNGTFLNGERVTGTVDLTDGDTIRLGSVAIVFRVYEEGDATQTHVPG